MFVQDLIEDRVIENIDTLNLNDSSEKSKTESFQDDDTVNNLEWKEKKKHIFILSSAGKPVYSR